MGAFIWNWLRLNYDSDFAGTQLLDTMLEFFGEKAKTSVEGTDINNRIKLRLIRVCPTAPLCGRMGFH